MLSESIKINNYNQNIQADIKNTLKHKNSMEMKDERT